MSLIRLSNSDIFGPADYQLTHLYGVDSSTSTLLTGPFPVEGVSDYFLLLPCFTEIHAFNANSVDPDLTPRLPMSLLWGSRHK